MEDSLNSAGTAEGGFSVAPGEGVPSALTSTVERFEPVVPAPEVDPDNTGLSWTERMVERAAASEAAAHEAQGDFGDVIADLRRMGFQNADEIRSYAEATRVEAEARQQLDYAGRALWAERYLPLVESGEMTTEEAGQQWQSEMQAFQNQLFVNHYEQAMANANEQQLLDAIYADASFTPFHQTGEEGLDLARVYAELAQVPLQDSAAYFNRLLAAAEERGMARERARRGAAFEKLSQNSATVVPVMGASASVPTERGNSASDWLGRKLQQAGLS